MVNQHCGTVQLSKFMELGKGEWSLPRLRGLFFKHMESYERIFTLRALSDAESHKKYELVEIPKALLLGADRGEFEVMENSKQNPKPGYCRVCLLYTSPSPRDGLLSRMPSSA